MTGAADQGFAAMVLARADGRAETLRPKITPHYGEDTAPGPLIQEITQEITAAPTADQAEPPETPVPASQTETQISPAHEPAKPNTPEMEQRLMPERAPEPADIPAPVETQPNDRIAAPEDTQDHAVPAETLQATTTPPMASVPDPGSKLAEKQARSAAKAPAQPTSLAAAVARLGTSLGDSDDTPLMPEQAQPQAPAAPIASKDHPIARTETADAEPRPVHIHIGEIVIEGDAPPAPATATPAPPPTWEPTLSLDAYRSARQRGER